MAYGESTIVIERPAREVIDFVMDLRRYRHVDEKLGTIHSVDDSEDGEGKLVRFTPKLMGMPGPPTTQKVVAGDQGISIRGVPAWTDVMMTFEASFTCEETTGGTRVTRKLDFKFKKPFSWIFDPIFNRWLVTAVPEELRNAKAYMEAGRHLN